MLSLNLLEGFSALLVIVLGGGLIWLLTVGVFRPIEDIARTVQSVSPGTDSGQLEAGDLSSLRYHIRALMVGLNETRSHMETRLRETEHSARLAAVGHSVARLAHEIRNPLSIIGGFARMIEKRPEAVEENRESAQTIYRQAVRLENLLTDVLQYSRPGTIAREAVVLNDIVNRAVQAIGVPPAGIRLRVDLETNLGTLKLCPDPIEQVIINLVRNAFEAMEGSEGVVSIATTSIDGQVLLSVSDTGPGIPVEVQKRILEPFFTTKKKGSGLGLAICSQIAADHGAEFCISSSPGEGSTFTLKFNRKG